MRRSTTIDDAVFNFRIAGQVAIGLGSYFMFASCGGLLMVESWGSRTTLVGGFILLGIGWLVVANALLAAHYQRVDREHHRCTKERIGLGIVNSIALAIGSGLVFHLLMGDTSAEPPIAIMYLSGLAPPAYMIWQGAKWWREANRMDRIKNNQCARCGYDLRESPDRCPECGTVAAKAS